MTADNKPLKESILKRMHQNRGFDASGIEIEEVQDILFLKGTVSRESDKDLAARIAFSIPGVTGVVNQLTIRDHTGDDVLEKFSRDTDIKISALMKLTAIPQIVIIEPDVSVTNGTLILYGIVDAFWKKASLETIMNEEFPDLYVENALTVISPRGDVFPPGKIPADEPEMFHGARSVSDVFKGRHDRPVKK
jgi:osmotically-inducible protein OsmY